MYINYDCSTARAVTLWFSIFPSTMPIVINNSNVFVRLILYKKRNRASAALNFLST
jgi:hypothetical protein